MIFIVVINKNSKIRRNDDCRIALRAKAKVFLASKKKKTNLFLNLKTRFSDSTVFHAKHCETIGESELHTFTLYKI